MTAIENLQQSKTRIEVLIWYAGEQLYGLYLQDCKEVIKNIDILTVPHSKKYVVGILNLRGEIITVIDAGVKLGYPQKNQEGKKSIIRLKDKSKISIMADEILDILEIETDLIEQPPSNLNEREMKCISKIANIELGAILILNLNGITEIE